MDTRTHLCAMLLLCAACHEPIGTRQSAVNGTADIAEEWPGVLGMRIDKPEGVASCTGVLIAPNLVLTARHCVSSTQPTIVCGSSPLAPPVAGSDVLSTNDVMIEATSLAVRAVRVEVPPDGDDECGFDIAAVILQAEVPNGAVYPPRLDRPVTTGEMFTAVGYGRSATEGIGTRRVLSGVPVACVGGVDCTNAVVQSTEWMAGDDAFCRSDSGAPAIDGEGRVIGVISKGVNPCTTPILSSTYAWRDWIRSVGRMAAEEGGYPPPAWTTAPTPDAGTDAAVEVDAGSDATLEPDAGTSGGGGGCTVTSTSRAPWLLLALLMLAWRKHD